MISITRTILTFLLVGSLVLAQCDEQVVANEIKENKENTIPQIAKDSHPVNKNEFTFFNKIHRMASNYAKTNYVQVDSNNNYFVTLEKDKLIKIYEPFNEQQIRDSFTKIKNFYDRDNIRIKIV